MNKIPLSEGKIQGILREIEQEYRFNFMPHEIIDGTEYSDKIELVIAFNNGKFAYRSLRFKNTAQMKGFIMNAIKAYVFFARQTKEINMQNFIYKKNKLLNEINEVI